ncbi:transposase [Streptomyces sp. NPDC005406]|uniref:transposase n=1 Tax=Streptomyces sp. NPDC005406 TaxID=3155339 RepID=UPI003452DAEB
MKNYPPSFKAAAVARYESRPEATIRSVAIDLGINPETLRNCVRARLRPVRSRKRPRTGSPRPSKTPPWGRNPRSER